MAIKTLLLMVFMCGMNSGDANDQRWSLASPDGRVVVGVGLVGGEDGAGKERVVWRIEHGNEGERVEVMPWSPLGIVREDEAFVDGLVFVGQSEVAVIEEEYTMPHGKRRACRSSARQRVFTFRNANGAKVEVIVRAANDGGAMRYRFPEPSEEVRTVTGERTGFRMPADGRAWMTPYQEASKYTPAYEEYYLNEIPVGTASPNEAGWAFPALFHAAGRWVLLAEAAVDGSYCGCRLERTAPDGVYRIRFPDPGEGNGQGSVEPGSKLPWSTPWRVVMVADSLAGIVESTLVTDLNTPSCVQDTSWIKPGRVAWSWWSDHDSPQFYDKMVPFIDLAAEMGWEYFLVDANWTLMNGGDVRRLADYAKQKGVGLFLWYNSGGEHNIVTEKPRGCMKDRSIRNFEFELLKKWGVAGVKVDFFQSDKQNIMGLYHDILRDAAEHHIMVNFHGCTVPRGWERTWPHLMTMEAVKGEECYTFAREFPKRASQYNTIVPFTRNAVGPADYTPCAFTDDKYPHLTTNAHELALAVVFESGLLHFADRVSAYRELPEEPKQLLREIPVAWDEIHFIDGYPGKFAVLARRKDNTWYVGAINGQKQPQRVRVPLEFLEAGTHDAQIIGDGKDPRSFGTRQLEVKPADTITLSLRPYGGGVIRLTPER